ILSYGRYRLALDCDRKPVAGMGAGRVYRHQSRHRYQTDRSWQHSNSRNRDGRGAVPTGARNGTGACSKAFVSLFKVLPMRQPRILMCPPDHFGIEYEINPWMNRQHEADRAQAKQQWNALVAALRDLGVQIELMEPRPGLPDLVFTANAG